MAQTKIQEMERHTFELVRCEYVPKKGANAGHRCYRHTADRHKNHWFHEKMMACGLHRPWQDGICMDCGRKVGGQR